MTERFDLRGDNVAELPSCEEIFASPVVMEPAGAPAPTPNKLNGSSDSGGRRSSVKAAGGRDVGQTKDGG